MEFFDLTGKDRLIYVLTYLETLKVEKATDIRVSVHSVVVLLKPLSTYPPQATQYVLAVQDIHYGLRAISGTNYLSNLIADRILKKWEAILRGDMQNVRWVCHGHLLTVSYLSTAQNYGKKVIDITCFAVHSQFIF